MQIKMGSDPVFKDRIVVANQSPTRNYTALSMGGLMIIGVVAGLAYVSPHIPHSFLESSPTEENAPVTPDNTANASEHHTATKSNSAVMTPLKPVDPPKPPTNFVEKPKTDDKTPQTVATAKPIEAKPAPTPTETKTETTPPTSNSNTNNTEAPQTNPTPTATPTTTPPPTETIATTNTVQTPPPAQPVDEVATLVDKAQKQIERTRLTTPAGDNAFETYEALKKISPDAADKVREQIVKRYIEQSQKAVERGRITSSGGAFEMYRKLNEIAPENKDTQALMNSMLNTLQKQASAQIQKGNLINPDGNNAYATYQDIIAIYPTSEMAKVLLQDIVKALLEKADKQVDQRKYLTPKDDNAYASYQAVLEMSPNNKKATEGIKNIVKQYQKHASTKQKEGDYKASMTFIEAGLQINPTDKSLLELREKAEKKLR
ncbi:hypothetical protein BegalDRAFT_1736 [Beggiatoa alba B18LD]|uniref:Uncharacterized protein n=1 Tax=Beggiatoa alba B18LD TaxID=395493 RepID=I3CG70_9GAMM|nr:hypothetical protein [Beggiatoa alba]EIJ42613.1 hypothetical protein BegalDRAFT_1736 [Beggiatoa alba B18LD]